MRTQGAGLGRVCRIGPQSEGWLGWLPLLAWKQLGWTGCGFVVVVVDVGLYAGGEICFYECIAVAAPSRLGIHSFLSTSYVPGQGRRYRHR